MHSPGWGRCRGLFAALIVAGLLGAALAAPAGAASLTWATKTAMPTARYALMVAMATNGKVYAIGGIGTSGAAVATVEEYTSGTNSWVGRADLPAARNGAAVVGATDGKVYVFSGFVTGVAGSSLTVLAYDPSANTWTSRANILTGVGDARAAQASDGKIYVIGGQGSTGFNQQYDPVGNAWVAKANMPTARYALGVAAAPNGKVYAIGGISAGGSVLNTVEEYNPGTNTWTNCGGACASMPTFRADPLAVTASNGKIYAIGGALSGFTATNVVEEYDPATNTWTNCDGACAGMSTARWRHGAAGSGNKIYAVGGLGAGTLPTNEEATVVSDATAPTGTVVINGGAASTTSTAVSLALTCSDNVGCTEMQVATDGTADTEPFEAFATTKAVTLPAVYGTRTVAAKFKDAAGNVSAQATDTIFLDIPAVVTVNEPIGVSDAVGVFPPAQVTVNEAIGVSDAVGVFPPVAVTVNESVAVSDAVGVFPPVSVTVNESVAVSDAPGVFPPVAVMVDEPIGVSDAVGVFPPVSVTVNESVGVSDAVGVFPPVAVTVDESIGVSDAVGVIPPVAVTVNESVGVSDAVNVFPPVAVTVAETISVADSSALVLISPLAQTDQRAAQDALVDLATGVKPAIDQITDSGTGAPLPGVLIASYEANITFSSTLAQATACRLKPPLNAAPSDCSILAGQVHLKATHPVSGSGVATPIDPLAFVALRLLGSNNPATGNTTVNLNFVEIKDSLGSVIPQVSPPDTRTFLRGDALVDGIIFISDALYIGQHLVNPVTRPAGEGPGKVNPLNAGSVNHDAPIDVITVADAVKIAQFLVGNVNELFLGPAAPLTSQAGQTVATDTVPPSTSTSQVPEPNLNGWNRTNVSVTLTATDPSGPAQPGQTTLVSGVKEIRHRVNGGSVVVTAGASTQIVLDAKGVHTITYFAVDNAGNQESAKTLTVRIDKTPPQVTKTVSPAPVDGWVDNDGNPVTATWSGTDDLSGVASCSPSTVLTSGGIHSVTGSCTDLAGNTGSHTQSVSIVVKVPVDIRPGSFPNSINLNSKGNILVGVKTGITHGVNFDATIIVLSTVKFAGALALPIALSPQDFDSDGDLDMVYHFEIPKLDLTASSTQACLTGQTMANLRFKGCDTVQMLPSK